MMAIAIMGSWAQMCKCQVSYDVMLVQLLSQTTQTDEILINPLSKCPTLLGHTLSSRLSVK